MRGCKKNIHPCTVGGRQGLGASEATVIMGERLQTPRSCCSSQKRRAHEMRRGKEAEERERALSSSLRAYEQEGHPDGATLPGALDQL